VKKEIKLTSRKWGNMEFIHKKKEYSPRELYESFGDKLPLIVVCTQGFLGEKGWDTVGQGSVSFHWR